MSLAQLGAALPLIRLCRARTLQLYPISDKINNIGSIVPACNALRSNAGR